MNLWFYLTSVNSFNRKRRHIGIRIIIRIIYYPINGYPNSKLSVLSIPTFHSVIIIEAGTIYIKSSTRNWRKWVQERLANAKVSAQQHLAVRVRRPLAKKSRANQRKKHNVESTFSGLQTMSLSLTIRRYGSIVNSLFSCCCLLRNSAKIGTYSSSRSWKVIDQSKAHMHATSSYSHLDVSRIVYEILAFKTRK